LNPSGVDFDFVQAGCKTIFGGHDIDAHILCPAGLREGKILGFQDRGLIGIMVINEVPIEASVGPN
jgi:hypothetical protein